MDEVFRKMMEQIGSNMVLEFNKSTHENKTITKKEYVYKFISTFVHVNTDMNDPLIRMKKILHDDVNETSLCGPEVEFFNKLIDCTVEVDKYIQKLKEIYSDIDELENCQLGSSIKKCLIISEDLKFIN